MSLRVKVRVSWWFAKPECILFPPLWPPSSPFPGMECSPCPASLPSWLTLEPCRHIPPWDLYPGCSFCLCPLHLQVFAELQSQQWCPRVYKGKLPCVLCGMHYVSIFVASKLLYDLFISYFWWLSLSLLDSKFHVAKYFYVLFINVSQVSDTQNVVSKIFLNKWI